jgi:hypothetical protein
MMSPVVFIKLPSTVIVGLCEFLLCVTNLYSVPILMALTVKPMLKWLQDIQKWGGMIVILLDNARKHGLKSKWTRIKHISPWWTLCMWIWIFFFMYMNCGFYGFASCSVILREGDKLRVFEIGYWVMY